MLECLTLAGSIHRATGGLFDPTVQPLWALWAERATAGSRPTVDALAATRALGQWADLRLDAGEITMAPGMGLTLNGIGQGYIADRIAALLEAEGLTDILIDTGELRALGQGLELAARDSLIHRGHAAVGARKQPFTRHELQGPTDRIGHFLGCLDPVRGDVDHTPFHLRGFRRCRAARQCRRVAG